MSRVQNFKSLTQNGQNEGSEQSHLTFSIFFKIQKWLNFPVQNKT